METVLNIKVSSSQTQPSGSSKLVEHFFRHEYGKVVAHLTRQFGADLIENIEDAVQESLYKAMQTWPYVGPPDRPTAWILRVARNKLLDQLRRNKNYAEKKEDILSDLQTREAEVDVSIENELKDDLLKMMFACCHPTISPESQIILTLKILCGFSKVEIARALLKKEDAIAKAYTRARAKLRDNHDAFIVPLGKDLNDRLDIILKIIYLLFNEGYNSSSGEKLIRHDLGAEAIRLAGLILENNLLTKPKVHALMSLMCFHASRFDARIGNNGELLTLENQDRTKWHQELINKGLYHLGRSTEWGGISDYHIQATIASCHAQAKNYEDTDWEQILGLYDLQLRVNPSAIVALNRVVAFAKVNGVNDALIELDKIESSGVLNDYYLFYAVKGDFLIQVGKNEEAVYNLSKAAELTQNEAEKEYLLTKAQKLVNNKKGDLPR
ncbi:MAG: sigma-70 family RNA polymerase sigma factor [Bacteroidota bacterium]